MHTPITPPKSRLAGVDIKTLNHFVVWESYNGMMIGNITPSVSNQNLIT